MSLSVGYQRLEGLAILIAAATIYLLLDFDWWWFVIFILAFDISMAGYAVNKKVGAHLYNLVHNFSLPAAAFVGGILLHNDFLIALGLIWLAHIGLDRASGYGLKEAAGFRHTHLGRIGKGPRSPSKTG